MAKKRYTAETIIRKLREAEILQGQGQTMAQVIKQLGITEQTFYRWRKHYDTKRPHSALGYRSLAPEVVLPNDGKREMESGRYRFGDSRHGNKYDLLVFHAFGPFFCRSFRSYDAKYVSTPDEAG